MVRMGGMVSRARRPCQRGQVLQSDIPISEGNLREDPANNGDDLANL